MVAGEYPALSTKKKLEIASLTIKAKDATITTLKAENKRLIKWVNDLQSGMYINCVYCGHRYGPDDKVPCTMADALKKHIEKCPKHPMSALKQSLAAAKAENERLKGVNALIQEYPLTAEGMVQLRNDLSACRKVIEGVREWMLESQFCSAPYCRKCVVKLKQLLPEDK